MKIIPAIDILNGKCVRLFKGDYSISKEYSQNPVEVAQNWENMGAQRIHIVDLDGAKDGMPTNFDLIKKIRESVKCEIEVGGGIRNIETLENYFEIGIDKCILGSVAIENKSFLFDAEKKHGDKIILGVDAKNGFVATRGWIENSNVKTIDLILEIKDSGIEEIIYTDIAKDGTLSSPNYKETKELIDLKTFKIIASGGVSSLDDLKQLKNIGASGVIVGKALYENKFTLTEAQELTNH